MIANRSGSQEKKAAMALVCVVALAYLPAIFNNFVEWDDLTMIVRNPLFIHAQWSSVAYYFGHPFANLYMPLTCALWTGLAAVARVSTPDAQGAQMNPYVFHAASCLLHLTASLAVLGILRRATGANWPAAAGALLFALHPLQVESVAFVGAMNTPLAAALLLCATLLYLRSASTASASISARHRWRSASYWFATFLFVAALLSKPTTVVAPLLVLLLDLAINRSRFRVAFVAMLPWLILTIPCVIWTRFLQQGAPLAINQPLWTRPLVAGDAGAFYLGKLLLPLRLGIDYGRAPAVVLEHHWIWFAWIIPAALLLCAWSLRRVRPISTVGIAIFFLAMLPNSGLVSFDYQQYSTTADRYIYLSMLGAALIFADWSSRLKPAQAIVIASILLASCIVLTERQIRTWYDGQSLFRHAVAVNPKSWMAKNNLSTIVMDDSPGEAIELCRSAIALNPDFASAYNNLGSALMRQHQVQPALTALARAHELDPQNPTFAQNYRRAEALAHPSQLDTSR